MRVRYACVLSFVLWCFTVPSAYGLEGFEMSGTTLVSYTGEGGDLVIPSVIDGKDVIEIGELAFANHPTLTSVVVPGSVGRIDDWAFVNCPMLTTVVIEEGVEVIGEVAFYYCENLVDVSLPQGLLTIEDEAFAYCTSLVEIVIPDTVTKIKYGVFHACTSLERIVLPDSVKTLGDWVFYNCHSLVEVTLSQSLTKLEEGTFSRCTSLISLEIPSGVKILEDMLFFGATAMRLVLLPDTVEEIGDYLFTNGESIIYPEEGSGENFVYLWGYEGVVSDYALEAEQMFLENRPDFRLLDLEDVTPKDWFYPAVTFVTGYDLMFSSEGYFAPYELATRGLTAEVFALYSGEVFSSEVEEQEESGESQDVEVWEELESLEESEEVEELDEWDEENGQEAEFSDVGIEAQAYVAWCVANGVMSGYGEGVFGTEDTLTREQFATVLASYGRYLGLEIEGNTLLLEEFYDVWDISSWAVDTMAWAVEQGLFRGSEGYLQPTGRVTRGEVATVLLAFQTLVTME